MAEEHTTTLPTTTFLAFCFLYFYLFRLNGLSTDEFAPPADFWRDHALLALGYLLGHASSKENGRLTRNYC